MKTNHPELFLPKLFLLLLLIKIEILVSKGKCHNEMRRINKAITGS